MTARQSLKRVIRERHEGKIQRFADAHGFKRPLVSMWCSGRRTPGGWNAQRLEAATGIPASSWLPAAERRALAASASRHSRQV